jgi:menaquinone-dependent protoporphyrinogen oxidase
MKKNQLLIVYATTDGQTAKIARRMAKIAAALPDVEAQADDVHDVSPSALASCDSIIVAASVHFGRHQRSMVRFIRANLDELSKKHSAFVSVSGASAKASGRSEAEKYALQFLRRTRWVPDDIELVAGATLFTKYNPLLRFVMRRIAASRGIGTDVTRDYEHTDWSAVEQFARSFASRFQVSSAPPSTTMSAPVM